jgi:hypothetical protein
MAWTLTALLYLDVKRGYLRNNASLIMVLENGTGKKT